MAIGTLAAIGIGAAVGGQVLGASSANKASKRAANVATDTAAQNNALARENRDMLIPRIDPFVNNGIAAGGALNSFLGLAPTQQQTMPAPNATTQFQGGLGFEGMDGPQGRAFNINEPDFFGGQPWQSGPVSQVMQTQQPQGVNGRDAFRTFLDNSDYGFQFQEGANALNSGYAGAGTVKSGAAMKGLEQFRQNLQSGYRGEFLDRLGGQQQVGLGGASALAGVGQNFVNQTSANNNSAGTAQANSILAKQNPFANALSLVGGGLFRAGT